MLISAFPGIVSSPKDERANIHSHVAGKLHVSRIAAIFLCQQAISGGFAPIQAFSPVW